MAESDKGHKLLWIDDRPEETRGQAAWLEQLGNKVEHAQSADAARSLLRAEHFDLLLVDEFLLNGGTRGSDVVRQLRNGVLGTQNAAAPFVFVTAYSEMVDRSKLEDESGFLGTINKSEDLTAELSLTLERLVTLSGLVDASGSPLSTETPAGKELVVRFRQTEREVLGALAARPELLHSLHHRDFEELVAELFDRNGFEVNLTASTRDGGADLYALRATNLGELRFAVECKRYSPNNPVGPALVRQLRGVVDREQATCGVLVTTSRFTVGAQKERATAPHRLLLHDFDQITAWLRGAPILG